MTPIPQRLACSLFAFAFIVALLPSTAALPGLDELPDCAKMVRDRIDSTGDLVVPSLVHSFADATIDTAKDTAKREGDSVCQRIQDAKNTATHSRVNQNRDVPPDEMSDSNKDYLESGRRDVTALANETVQVTDELISAAIAGNVTHALNALYNYSPVAAPLRNATQMADLTEDAVLALVKCASPAMLSPIQAASSAAKRVMDGDYMVRGIRDPRDQDALLGLPNQANDFATSLTNAAEAAATSRSPDPLLGIPDQASQFGAAVTQTIASAIPPAPDPTPTLGLADEAGPIIDAASGAAHDSVPQAPDANATASDPQGAVLEGAGHADDMITCTSQALTPFLDAILNRTVDAVPIVGDLVAQLEEEVLPTVVTTADAILPIELNATLQAFMERPVSTVAQTALGLPAYLSDPSNQESTVQQTAATAALTVAQILKPSTRHPQFLYDFTHNQFGQLATAWEQVASANRQAGSGVDAIATADSLVFNLYTNRGGSETITGVPIAKRTCIQLDSSTATRDVAGCDLYATLTPSASGVSTSLPSLGTRFTPTLRLETALPTARFALEALGYLQLPNSPYVAVLGFNAQDGTNGVPAIWEATLDRYDTGETGNRTIALTSSFIDTRTAIPIDTVAASFRVDENAPGKPVVGDNETVLEVASAAMPNRFSIEAKHDESTRSAEANLQSSAAMPLDVLLHDHVGVRDAVFNLHARDLPLGNSRITSFTAPSLSWTWSALSATQTLDAGYRVTESEVPLEAFQVNATQIPGVVALASDASLHRHQFQASAAPTSFQFLVADGSDSCQRVDGTRHAAFRHAQTSCMVGQLAGYTQLAVDSTNSLAHVAGTRDLGDAHDTVIDVRDGNDVSLHASDSPSSWDAQFSLTGNQTQDLQWNAAAPVSALAMQARLDQGDRHPVLKADLDNVPATVNATLNLATGEGTLLGSDAIGSIALALTTTGSTVTAGSDSLSLRFLPNAPDAPDVEAAWKAVGAKSLNARIAANGTFEASGEYAGTRPLSVLFHDAKNDVALNITGLSGTFAYSLAADANLGQLSFRQLDAQAPDAVTLDAAMPGGRTHMDLDAPSSRIAIDVNLRSQTTTLSSSGATGHLALRYATGTEAPTAGTGNHVVLQDDANGERGANFALADIESLAVTRLVDHLTVDSSFASTSDLLVHMEDATGAVELALADAPTHADTQYPEGSFTWASSTPASFDLKAALDAGPRYAHAAGTATQVSATWTTKAVDAFDATVTHDGGAIPDLTVEDFRGNLANPQQGSGWSFHALQLPASAQLHFEAATATATATVQDAAGQDAPAGRIEASLAERSGSLPRLRASVQGLWMSQTGQALSAALVADGLKRLDAPLLADASDPTASTRLDLERAEPGDFAVSVRSERQAASYTANLAAASTSFKANLTAGSTAQQGFSAQGDSDGPSGPVAFRLTRDQGLDLAYATMGSTPATFAFSWNAGAPAQLIASTPMTVAIQCAPTLATAPWANGDFLALKWNGAQDTEPRFGAKLSGFTSFASDPANQRLAAQGDATTAHFVLDYTEPATHLQVEASDLGPDTRVEWDTANRTFHAFNDAPTALLRLQASPADASPRLLAGFQGAQAGTVSFEQGAGFQSFLATATGNVSRFWLSADEGSTTPMQVLSGKGVFLDTSANSRPFQFNIANLHRIEGAFQPATGPYLQVESAGSGPAQFRMASPAGTFVASSSFLPSGIARINWPDPAATDALRIAATGFTGAALTVGALFGNQNGQLSVQPAPALWDVAATPLGTLDYEASTAASQLSTSGLFQDAAFNVRATGVPTGLHMAPQTGMRTGSIHATSPVGRLSAAVAPGSSNGQIARPSSPGYDQFTVDATGANGILSMDLPQFQSVAWEIPDASAESSSARLDFVLDLGAATTRPAILQAVHPDHQTRIDASRLAPHSQIRLDRSMTQWALMTDTPESFRLQHQDVNAGSFTASVPGTGTLTVAPKTGRSMSWAGSASPRPLSLASSWGAGTVQVDLATTPPGFAMDANALLPGAGTVAVSGVSALSSVKALFVPTSVTAVNRATARGDLAAIEMAASTPYLALDVHDFASFQWVVPDSAASPISATLHHTAPRPGETSFVLSGAHESATARARDSSRDVTITVASSPVTVATEFVGGTTQRFDLTHVGSDSGQTMSTYLVGAEGSTQFSATGSEPASVRMDASSPRPNVGFQASDGGTLLKLRALQAPTHLEAVVERGSCGVNSPFRGHVSTLGSGTAGWVSAAVGDGNTAPNPRGPTVDARCSGSDAHVAVQLPALKDTRWDTTPCHQSENFDVTRSGTNFYVEDANGFLQGRTALKSQDTGTLAFNFTSGNGVSHAASDRLAYLAEKVTFPTCMEFRDAAVSWYTVDATDVPGDLHVNLNKATGALGELPTLTLKSPSGASTGSLTLRAQLSGHNFQNEQWHKARIDARSPIGKLDAYVGSGTPVTRNWGDTDGFQFVWDGDIHWHMQFQNLQSLFGSANRQCRSMKFDVDYQRASGVRNMLDYIDLGKGCDRLKLDVQTLPSHFQYTVDWQNLFDLSLNIARASEAISHLGIWSDGVCFNQDFCMGYGTNLYFTLAMDGIPSGPTAIRTLVRGASGVLRLLPAAGAVDHVNVQLTEGKEDEYISADLYNVRASLEWDLDGNTGYDGIPIYFSMDTGGLWMTANLRMRNGDYGVGIGAGMKATNYFLGLGTYQLFDFIPVPWLYRNGSICGNPYMEALIGGDWWVIPDPLGLDDVFGC